MARGNGKAPSIVDELIPYIEKELVDCMPELAAAVKVGEGEGSISITMQLKQVKPKRGAKSPTNLVKGEIKTRVRAPRQPIPVELHLDDSGQLAFGYVVEEVEGGEKDAGKGKGKGAGAQA